MNDREMEMRRIAGWERQADDLRRERDEALLKWSTLSHQMDAEVAKHTDTLQARDAALASAEYWQAEAERFRLEAREDARAAGEAQKEVDRLRGQLELIRNRRPCGCIGHTMPGVRHMMACCDVPHIDQL